MCTKEKLLEARLHWNQKISLSFKDNQRVRAASATPTIPYGSLSVVTTFASYNTHISRDYSRKAKRKKQATNQNTGYTRTRETERTACHTNIGRTATERLSKKTLCHKPQKARVVQRPQTVDNGILAHRNKQLDHTLVQAPINEVFLAFSKVGARNVVPVKDDVLAMLKKRWKNYNNVNLVSCH